MPLLRILCLLMLMIGFTWHLPAQDQSPGFFRLNEEDLSVRTDSGQAVVVAASKSLKRVDDLPVTVYIITRDEIIGNGYTTLVEALSGLPGIRVSQPGSAIDGEAFQIQGVYGNYYCKILIDGITVKPSEVSGMPIGRQLPIRQADRIEVIFGPASSVYGAEALGGVINIVTHQSDRPVTAQADIALGSLGFEYLNVSIGGKVGRKKNVMTYNLYGGNSIQRDLRIKYDRTFLYNPSLYDSTYSYLQKPYYQGDSTSIGMSRLPASSNMLGFSFNWRGWTVQVMRMARSMHSSVDRDPSVYSYSDPMNAWSESIQRYRLSYLKSWKKISSESNFSWLNYRLDNQSGFGLLDPVGQTGDAYKYAASDDVHLEEQVTILPVRGLELVTGLMYQYSGNLPMTNDLAVPFDTEEYSLFSEDAVGDTSIFHGFGFNPVVFQRAAGYLQVYYTFRQFTLMAGFRTEYHSLFEFSHNPRVALMYKTKKDLSLRASVTTGHRVPALYYMFNSLAYRQGEGIYYEMVPNPDLEPEQMLAAEAGIRWNRLKWLQADAAIFYHRIFNQFTRSFVILDTAIYPQATNPMHIAGAYVNDENSMAQLLGLQMNLRFSEILPAIDLKADLNLTITKGNEILPNGLGRIDDYRQMPGFIGQFNIALRPQQRISILLRNSFSTGWVRGYLPLDPDILRQIGYPIEIDGFYTLDVHARFAISRNFEAFVRFNNVTNAHYGGYDAYSDKYSLFYNPQYGFNFRFGLSFRME